MTDAEYDRIQQAKRAKADAAHHRDQQRLATAIQAERTECMRVQPISADSISREWNARTK